MNDFVEKLEKKIAFIFDEFKLLPSIPTEERTSYTFLAKPRKQDTFEKLKAAISYLKSGIDVEEAKAVSNGHQFYLGDKKINFYYVKQNESFDFFYDVSSYGIVSILGKVVKGFDLKLTQFGLVYEEKLNVKNHNSKVGEFKITDDARDLFDLLGLDYDRFKKGFQTHDEVFEFVLKCPYLKTSVFSDPKKEHKHTMFQDFQAYIIKNNISQKPERLSFEDIDNHFEDINFEAEVDALKEKERRKREAIEKFNGRVILDYYPNFDKSKIGTGMGYFKHSFRDVEDYRNFLSEFTTDEIMARFLETIEPNPIKRKSLELEYSKEV